MRKSSTDRAFARVLADGWMVEVTGAPGLSASWAGVVSHVSDPHRRLYVVGDSLSALAVQAERIAATRVNKIE